MQIKFGKVSSHRTTIIDSTNNIIAVIVSRYRRGLIRKNMNKSSSKPSKKIIIQIA